MYTCLETSWGLKTTKYTHTRAQHAHTHTYIASSECLCEYIYIPSSECLCKLSPSLSLPVAHAPPAHMYQYSHKHVPSSTLFRICTSIHTKMYRTTKLPPTYLHTQKNMHVNVPKWSPAFLLFLNNSHATCICSDTHLRLCECFFCLHVRVYIYTHTRTHTRIYIYITHSHTRKCFRPFNFCNSRVICTFSSIVCTYVYTHVCLYVPAAESFYVCMYVCIYIHICLYVPAAESL